MMHGHEKSDSVIVAAKPANKAEQPAAEPVEPRTGTRGMRPAKNAQQDAEQRAMWLWRDGDASRCHRPQVRGLTLVCIPTPA
jgi:hypothetical protein